MPGPLEAVTSPAGTQPEPLRLRRESPLYAAWKEPEGACVGNYGCVARVGLGNVRGDGAPELESKIDGCRPGPGALPFLRFCPRPALRVRQTSRNCCRGGSSCRLRVGRAGCCQRVVGGCSRVLSASRELRRRRSLLRAETSIVASSGPRAASSCSRAEALAGVLRFRGVLLVASGRSSRLLINLLIGSVALARYPSRQGGEPLRGPGGARRGLAAPGLSSWAMVTHPGVESDGRADRRCRCAPVGGSVACSPVPLGVRRLTRAGGCGGPWRG
jgi:hypothetical protein